MWLFLIFQTAMAVVFENDLCSSYLFDPGSHPPIYCGECDNEIYYFGGNVLLGSLICFDSDFETTNYYGEMSDLSDFQAEIESLEYVEQEYYISQVNSTLDLTSQEFSLGMLVPLENYYAFTQAFPEYEKVTSTVKVPVGSTEQYASLSCLSVDPADSLYPSILNKGWGCT